MTIRLRHTTEGAPARTVDVVDEATRREVDGWAVRRYEQARRESRGYAVREWLLCAAAGVVLGSAAALVPWGGTVLYVLAGVALVAMVPLLVLAFRRWPDDWPDD
ncbi:MAG TPA: hypothetical protein VGX28_09015 [Frankiaceae bacterium]|jgi:Flp pilus assembly protein TadB|nr:hypothetical protein [Frankiaceae bacterium]